MVCPDFRKGTRDPDIYMFDLKVLADIPIGNGPYNQTNPSFSESSIVWTDNRNGNYNVYLYNITRTKSWP